MDKPTILVVEDNEIQRKVINLLAVEYGYRAVLVGTCAEACEAFLVGVQYGLVLMDIRLPDESGMACRMKLREFEAMAGAPPVPIIAMTGYVSMNDRENWIAGGFQDCLIKPFSSREFKEMMAKWVGATCKVVPMHPRNSGQSSS